MPIFFVLSGIPAVRSMGEGSGHRATPPQLERYALRRIRRIMPAYVVAVLLLSWCIEFFTPAPNPGQTWLGLYSIPHTDADLHRQLPVDDLAHQGLSQMWSLAVEVAFYAALPLLAYLLLVVVCRDAWRPDLTADRLAALAMVSPMWLIVLHTTDWLPNSAGMWLPAHLACFAGGMALAVLRRWGCDAMRPQRFHWRSSVPGRVDTPRGRRDHVTGKDCLRLWPRPCSTRPSPRSWWRRWRSATVAGCAPAEQQADGVAGRDFLRDLPAARGADGRHDGVGVAVAGVYRLDDDVDCSDTRDHGSIGCSATSVYQLS